MTTRHPVKKNSRSARGYLLRVDPRIGVSKFAFVKVTERGAELVRLRGLATRFRTKASARRLAAKQPLLVEAA